MWLNCVFVDLANENKRNCLTIDCDNVNKNGLGRFHLNASNPEKQVCYFGENRNDQIYKIFISERIKSGEFAKGIYFKIIRVQSKTDKETFDATKTLERYGSGILRSHKRGRDESQLGNEVAGEVRHSKSFRFFPTSWESAKPRFLSRR